MTDLNSINASNTLEPFLKTPNEKLQILKELVSLSLILDLMGLKYKN